MTKNRRAKQIARERASENSTFYTTERHKVADRSTTVQNFSIDVDIQAFELRDARTHDDVFNIVNEPCSARFADSRLVSVTGYEIDDPDSEASRRFGLIRATGVPSLTLTVSSPSLKSAARDLARFMGYDDTSNEQVREVALDYLDDYADEIDELFPSDA